MHVRHLEVLLHETTFSARKIQFSQKLNEFEYLFNKYVSLVKFLGRAAPNNINFSLSSFSNPISDFPFGSQG